ncbi:hemerythrin domain-containing protein [Arhodomonas sp. AD133]|uniref:hemerythrin domain-containing protein n=1 Tax=Arhodomonas sp. AD133 TaxID=3415009 RepID=UPI003EB93AD1
MHEVIAQLRDEHQEMSRVLGIIEREIDRVSDSGPADFELLTTAVYYITEYPDLFHHAKEDLLYRYLRRRRRRAQAMVQTLTEDHERLRTLGLALLEVVEDAAQDHMVRRDVLISRGNEYLRAEREHMRWEEREVFPLVEKSLREDDWAEIEQTLSPDGVTGLRPITRERFQALRDSLGE